jgi:hypothetical protein
VVQCTGGKERENEQKSEDEDSRQPEKVGVLLVTLGQGASDVPVPVHFFGENAALFGRLLSRKEQDRRPGLLTRTGSSDALGT